VNGVGALALAPLRDLDGVRQHVAFLLPRDDVVAVDGAELDLQVELPTDARADRADHFDEEARTVLQRTAVFVGAIVDAGGEKLGKQVTVGRVQLDAIEAGLARAPGAGGECLHEMVDLGLAGSAAEKAVQRLLATMRLTVDGMVARGFGRVINIVSRSVKMPQLELGLSNGARSGLVGFVAGLARQTVAHNVTINNLLPGIFDSDAQRAHVGALVESSGKTFEELWRARAEANPARRYGRPEELGAYCAFLCSQHAGFITGQNLLIDGGSYPGTH